eukprot:GEMP01129685.1.p1 GENE.GEMP01129685.1~~GEMP01129685.1.p1  ORF type:complete len:106 (+),score=32.17 GEMP01129685.1:104-421(+)
MELISAQAVSDDLETHDHRYFELYLEFQRMTEKEMETFCEREAMSEEEFIQRCQEAFEDEGCETEGLLNAFLSATDYDSFCRFLMEFAVEQMTEEDEEDDEQGGQ